MPASITRWFETEDLLLTAWLIVVEPLANRLLGGALHSTSAGAPLLSRLFVAAFYLVAGLGAVACLLTRSRSAPPPEPTAGGDPDVSTPSGYARLPMIVVLGLLFDSAGRALQLPFGDWLFAGSMLAWGVSFFLQAKLPPAPDLLRRVLMTPAIIAMSTEFTGAMNGGLDGFNLGSVLAAYGTPEWSMVSFVACMGSAAVLVMYVMFVFAPRQIAGSGGSWRHWALRFLLYVVGVLLNIGPLKVVG
ncbi:MAG: hypothetical protein HZB53_05320 [Chloroflexi bacterium]|nr:hypothetical protein [Chloroflexota bacterium]